MLRLKGEPDDQMPDDARRDAPSAERSPREERTSADDGIDGSEIDYDEEPGRWSGLSDSLPLRGLGIAGATFVPTFLAVFVGLPYLLGAATPPRTAGEPPPVATVSPNASNDSSWSVASSIAQVLRGDGADRPASQPPATSTPPSAATSQAPEPPAQPVAPPVAPKVAPSQVGPVQPAPVQPAPAQPAKDPVPRERKQAQDTPSRPDPPATAGESNPTAASPALPPASPRVPEPERKATASRPAVEHRSAPEPRQASATPDPRPRAQSSRSAGDWTPAAAFADRDAASRLATSIERQGYPVEIRQDGSSTRPWVVWIGSQPSGGARRR